MAAKKPYIAPRNAFDLIPTDEDDQPAQRDNAKTLKPAKVKKIFSYNIDPDVGERIRLYARKVADRPVGDVLEQAAREFLERVGG